MEDRRSGGLQRRQVERAAPAPHGPGATRFQSAFISGPFFWTRGGRLAKPPRFPGFYGLFQWKFCVRAACRRCGLCGASTNDGPEGRKRAILPARSGRSLQLVHVKRKDGIPSPRIRTDSGCISRIPRARFLYC